MLRRKSKGRETTSTTPEESAAAPATRFARPKILLVDMADEVEQTLQKEGYNVASGTFGSPYRVTKGSHYEPVVFKASLPNYTEQEIFVIDLRTGEAVQGAPAEKITPMEEPDWWAKCSDGVIDPRPRAMTMVRERLDLILNNGGAFIIFADSRHRQDLVVARQYGGYNGFHIEREIDADNWSFLSILSSVLVTSDRGQEITVTNGNLPIARLVEDYIERATFTCTLDAQWDIEKQWGIFAKNKYGTTVSSCIVPAEKVKTGWVFIFPRLEDTAGFLAGFFKNILPDLAPRLFPEAEGQKWVHRTDYELPTVLHTVRLISEIQDEAAEKIRELEASIASERTANQFLYDLLRETGDKLVAAVKTSLSLLGFTAVVDVDEEMKRSGKDSSLREDLRVHDISPVLVVDIKGIAGKPADAEALQAQKHAFIYIQEQNRADVRGLTIINHQRMLPPLDRDNDMPYRKEILDNSTQLKLGLMTTWDLFRLVRGFVAHKWSGEWVKPVLYQTGRILPRPMHYQLIGKVKHVWKNAFSVELENAELRIGDRISIECSVDFDEQPVTSLQLNDSDVDVGRAGDEMGIGRDETLPKLKTGYVIYRITPPEAG